VFQTRSQVPAPAEHVEVFLVVQFFEAQAYPSQEWRNRRDIAIAKLCKSNPDRIPEWRAERVICLDSYPNLLLQPSDDRYVRSYLRLQQLQEAARLDEIKRYAATLKHPHAHFASQICYGWNREPRHVLEASILTGESSAAIAKRIHIEEKTVIYYEALFFDVRDRLHDVKWINTVISGLPGCLFPPLNGAMTEDQRGFLYRMFGYYAGPEVLLTVGKSIGRWTMPNCREDTTLWLDYAVERIVRAWTVARRADFEQDAVAHLLKQAAKRHPMPKMSKARRRPMSDLEQFARKFVRRLTSPAVKSGVMGRRAGGA
jgi:hypothetical protein